MKTQAERIKEAKKAYIIHLNPNRKGMLDRYAIYLLSNTELEILWPSDSHLGSPVSKPTDMLPYQKYTTLDQYPAYHFTLNGYNYSKTGELADMLKAINPKLIVERLTPGWSPGCA